MFVPSSRDKAVYFKMSLVEAEPLFKAFLILSIPSIVGAWAISAIASYVAAWKSQNVESKPSKVAAYPHGPRALPLVGNIFSFAALRANPDRKLVELAAKYGKMCMLWFGQNPVVIVHSPKVAKDLMDKVRKTAPSKRTPERGRANA